MKVRTWNILWALLRCDIDHSSVISELVMDRHDAKWIILLLLLGALGLATFLHFYEEAFPIASLDFKLSREEVAERAESYLTEVGYDVAEYERAQVFSQDSQGQIFLEQTLGLAEANRLAREWISIWFWQVRWFKPLQKEELRVNLDPAGRIVGFEHWILDSAEGENLGQDEALAIGEKFLGRLQRIDMGEYELIERSSEEHKARTDHTLPTESSGSKSGRTATTDWRSLYRATRSAPSRSS